MVRTKEIGHAIATFAATAPTIGTVPAGKTWIVKEWSFYNGNSPSVSGYLAVNRGADGFVVDRQSFTADTCKSGSGRFLVLEAGDSLQLLTAGLLSGDSLRIWVSGAELDGLAP